MANPPLFRWENRNRSPVSSLSWPIIIDVIAIVAEIFTIDENELMEQVIRDNRRLEAMQLIAQTA